MVTFGSFTQDPAANPDQLAKNNQQVVVNQVITDPDLVQNSYQLGNVLQTSNFVEYCNYKMENAKNQSQSFIWNFILVSHLKHYLFCYLANHFTSLLKGYISPK